jgi:hypothetical protein
MKRYLSFIVLLALMLGIFSVSHAQVTVTIGDGTANNYLPIYPWFNYSYSQTIYYQSDINIANQRIENIAFYWNGAIAGTNSCDWVVYMAHTDKTAFSGAADWVPHDQLTQVFAGVLELPATPGWVNITLQNPFVYNNTDNLLIAVDENTPGNSGSSAYFHSTGVTGTRALIYRSDSTNPDPAAPPQASSQRNAHANIKLQFGDLPTTPVLGLSPTEWDFGRKIINTTSNRTFTIRNIGVGTLNVTGISPMTDGFFSITDAPALPVNLGTGESATFNIQYAPTAAGTHTATFTVSDGRATTDVIVSGECYDPTIYTFPWVEDFTATTFPPEEWGRYEGLYPTDILAPSTYRWYRATNFAGEAGNPSARINIYGNSTKHWLVTPPIAIPATGYQLDFDVALTTYSGGNPVDPNQQQDDRFIVLISDDPTMVGAQILREWNNIGSEYVYNGIATQGEYQEIDLSGHVGSKFIGFYGESTASGGDVYLYLDNVRVRETPTAPIFSLDPTAWDFGRQAVNVTGSNTFTISNVGIGTLNLTGISPMTDGFFSVTDAPAWPVNLNAGQSVSFAIQYAPTAAGNHTATFTVSYEGGTADLAVSGECYDPTITSFPYLENFDGEWTGTPAAPADWTVVNANDDSYTWRQSSQYISPTHSEPYAAHGTGNTDDWLITPPINPGSDVRAIWWDKVESATRINSYRVYISTTTPDIASFTTELALIDCDNTEWTEHRLNLSDYTGQTFYLAFHQHASPSTIYGFGIDDFSLEFIPAVPEFTYTPDAIEFDPIRVNATTGYQDVTVVNNGGGNLNLTDADVSIIGTDAAMFELDTGNLPFNLGADASGTIPVRYNPTAIGAHSATLRMVYDGANYDVALSGRAVGENALFESFEDTTYPPVGWQTTWTRNTTHARYGAASAYRYGSTSTEHLLSTPLLTIVDGSTLEFWARSGSTNGILQVMYSTDRVAWTQLGVEITFAETNTWYENIINLSSLSGGNYYLALQTGSVSAGYYVDMFIGPDITPQVPDVPVLVSPANAATYISRKPTLGWRAGTETDGIPSGYKVYFGTDNPPLTEVADVSTAQYTFTDELLPETVYYWTVKAYNSAGMSEAAEPFSFTTSALGWVAIGTDATANGTTTYPAVYGGFYKNAREQYIITADELIAAGAEAGWLTSIGFNVQAPNNAANLPDFTIKIGTTEATEFTDNNFIGGPLQEGLTQVYVAPGPYTPTAGWNTHVFPIHYEWDGVSNLVIQTSFGMMGSYANNASTYYTTTNTQKAMYYRNDYTDWDTVTTGTRSYDRPNMLFRNIVPIVGPPAVPTLLSPADSTTDLPFHGFDLTWEPDLITGGVPDYYTVFLATDPETIYDEYAWETTNTSFNPVLEDVDFNFVYGQRYYWTVSATNTHGEGVQEPPFIFDIENDPTVVAYPWAENFDAIQIGQMPRNWTIIASHTGADDRGWRAASNVGSHTEPNAAVVYYHADYPKDEWMITVPFSMQGGQSYNISFAVHGEGWEGVPEALAVYWGTEPTVASMTANPALYDNNQVSYSGWNMEYLTFTPPATGIYYFGWHACSQTDVDYIAVDTITIDEARDIDLATVELAGDIVGNVGAAVNHNVTVRNFGSQAQSNYMIYIKEHGTNNILAQEQIAETIASGENKIYTLSWTPVAEGVVSVYAEVAATGDMNPANNVTEAKDVTIYAANVKVLYVGDPETTDSSLYYPINVWYKDFVAETVYLASEIQAQSGEIQAIVYYNNFSEDQDISLQVWMTNTTTANLSDSWLPWDGYQSVFDGTISCPAGVNEILIPLATPFAYTGQNLGIRTSKTWEDGYTSGQRWRYTASPNYPRRTRYAYSDGAVGTLDHAAPPTGSRTNNVPNISFVISSETFVETIDAPMVDVTISDTGANLTWELIPYAYSYKVYASEDPYTFGEEPATTVYTNAATMETTVDKNFYKVTANTYHNFGRSQAGLRNPILPRVEEVEADLIKKPARDRVLKARP